MRCVSGAMGVIGVILQKGSEILRLSEDLNDVVSRLLNLWIQRHVDLERGLLR